MKVPLLACVDLLVIEASLTGIAVARKAALQGESVLVAEARTYPGYEVSEWQRPFVTAGGAGWNHLYEWFPGTEEGMKPREAVFSMDAFKLHAEGRLLEAGVRLLYAVRPVSVRRKQDGFRVLLAGKQGLCAVDAARLLDCSETQITRMTAPFAPSQEYLLGMPGALTFTAEWENLPLAEGVLPLPEEWEMWKNRADVHRSGFSGKNRLVEFAFSHPYTRDAATEEEHLRKAHRKALEICRGLSSLPAFAGARFGTLSERAMPCVSYDPVKALSLADSVLSALGSGAGFVRVCPGGALAYRREDTATVRESLCLSELSDTARSDLVEEELPPMIAAEPCDVLVCGGGTSGASCARAAAESGAKTLVIDMNRRLGGTGTVGGVHYYWYGRRRGFTERIDREYTALAEQFHYPKTFYVWGEHDDWNMELKAETLLRGCEEAGAHVRFSSFLFGAAREQNRVTGVFAATPYGPCFFPARVTVDATGDGDIAVMAGAQAMYGSRRDRMTMWSCLAQFKQTGLYRGGIFTTSADVGDWEDYTRYLLVNRRRGAKGCCDHGTYLAPRETRHIRGDFTVTVREIVSGCRYPDTVTRCFSNFDTKGKSAADLVYFGYLPPQMEMDIPYRASLPLGLEGILVTGKAIAATHDACSGLRMQDDMQNHGGAIGLAAAMAARSDDTRRIEMKELHRELVRRGALPREEVPALTPQRPDFRAAIEGLTGEEAFETIDMDMSQAVTELSPIVLICLADRETVVPLLREAYQTAGGKRRFLLARLLLWHRDPAGADEILAAVSRALDETDGLPRRAGSVKFCQPYPDHGVMAEVSYLVNELYKLPDPRVLPLLERLTDRIVSSPRDFADQRTCVFSHIESVAYVAERLGDPAYLPALTRLLHLPEFSGIEREQGFDVDPIEERILWSKLIVARALARCGGREGYRALLGITRDARRLAAKSAGDELTALTGESREGWEQAVASLPERSRPQPWTEEIW